MQYRVVTYEAVAQDAVGTAAHVWRFVFGNGSKVSPPVAHYIAANAGSRRRRRRQRRRRLMSSPAVAPPPLPRLVTPSRDLAHDLAGLEVAESKATELEAAESEAAVSEGPGSLRGRSRRLAAPRSRHTGHVREDPYSLRRANPSSHAHEWRQKLPSAACVAIVEACGDVMARLGYSASTACHG